MPRAAERPTLRPIPLTIGRRRSSPNHGPRADGVAWPDAIVLHYTGMKNGSAAVDWLCNPVSEVSCHYVVAEDGGIAQLVPEDRRAWHAGRSCWAGVIDMNSASIGIEIVNGGHDFGLPAFPEAQIDAVAALCRDIIARRLIAPSRILAHSDIAPGRKRDPGERFPWDRLHAAGVGHWVAPVCGAPSSSIGPGASGAEVGALQGRFAAYGYDVPITGTYDDRTGIVVEAFQRHFRPLRVDGIADAETCATLEALVTAKAQEVLLSR